MNCMCRSGQLMQCINYFCTNQLFCFLCGNKCEVSLGCNINYVQQIFQLKIYIVQQILNNVFKNKVSSQQLTFFILSRYFVCIQILSQIACRKNLLNAKFAFFYFIQQHFNSNKNVMYLIIKVKLKYYLKQSQQSVQPKCILKLYFLFCFRVYLGELLLLGSFLNFVLVHSIGTNCKVYGFAINFESRPTINLLFFQFVMVFVLVQLAQGKNVLFVSNYFTLFLLVYYNRSRVLYIGGTSNSKFLLFLTNSGLCSMSEININISTKVRKRTNGHLTYRPNVFLVK
eukprot:TRINITY_DN22940_c0_g2_i9.p1 TRINITY_DN22940_c0_g2~~TRINITY_DN22940_c0_g2_i9.p1  ORF type:complete len:309 (+),score=-13.22 TRINITY_DN22940_c0_g2_i9:75-929(+)